MSLCWKVFVQGTVNPLGIQAIATFNAVNRVDDFAFTPGQSISIGLDYIFGSE